MPFWYFVWFVLAFVQPQPAPQPVAVPTYMTVYGPIPFNQGNAPQYVYFPPCIVQPGVTICP